MLPKDLPEDSKVTGVDDLICVFLRLVWRETQIKLKEAYKSIGCTFSRARVETVLTVPAQWTYAMCRTMEIIAQRAELPNVELVSEPEAAALWIKHDKPQRLGMPEDLVSGLKNPFLIVDIGGGTALGPKLSQRLCSS